MPDARPDKIEIKLFSSLATMAAIQHLTAEIEDSAKVSLATDFGPTVGLLERIRGGEKADLVILTTQAIDELIGQNILSPEGRADIASSLVGLAVRAGTPKPDIGSVDGLKRTLLGARSVAYSKIGASGIFFAGLLQRLGIAEEMESRSIVVPVGLTGTLAASGEAELAIQQISELMAAGAGIDIVGPLPPGAQSPTQFSIGVFSGSSHRAAVQDVLNFLVSPRAAAAYRATGLQPAA